MRHLARVSPRASSCTSATPSSSSPIINTVRRKPYTTRKPFPTTIPRTYSPLNPGNPFVLQHQDPTSAPTPSTPSSSSTTTSTYHTDDAYRRSIDPARAVPQIRTFSPIVHGIAAEEEEEDPEQLSQYLFSSKKQQKEDARMMGDDADYEAFLNKAQGQREGGRQTTTVGTKSEKVTVQGEVPAPLKTLAESGRVYTSDADEPFTPVSLPLQSSGKGTQKLDVSSFARAVDEDPSAVQDVGVEGFDPRGEYHDVIAAVKDAAGKKGDVKVFRVEGGGSRVWFWVVAVHGDRLVGVKVLSVE